MLTRKSYLRETCTLIIDTTQKKEESDSYGSFYFYPVFAITKENKCIEFNSFSVEASITDLLVYDGETLRSLMPSKNDKNIATYNFLIKYLSTDLNLLLKTITPHPFFTIRFDCEKFTYYLATGKYGTFSLISDFKFTMNYRSKINHTPYQTYAITAKTDDYYENNNHLSCNNYREHHFCYLGHGVYLSKFGRLGVYFTSYHDMLNAYFPVKYRTGTHKKTSGFGYEKIKSVTQFFRNVSQYPHKNLQKLELTFQFYSIKEKNRTQESYINKEKITLRSRL